MLPAQFQRPFICAVQVFRLPVLSVKIPRPHRMNDIGAGASEAGRNNCTPFIAVPDAFTGCTQFRHSGFPEDCAANAAAGPKTCICCIHNCIRRNIRDSFLLNLNRTHALPPLDFIMDYRM